MQDLKREEKQKNMKANNLCGKKCLRLLILSLLTLSLLSAVNVNIKKVSAVESPYIAVVPENIVDPTLITGENFTVSIYTNYGENELTEWDATAYQFHLFYDPYVLNCIKVTNGEVIVDGTATFLAGPFDNEAGELSLTVGFYDSPGEVTAFYRDPPYNGTLANVTFAVVGTGISSITIGPRTKLVGWNFTPGEEYNIIEAETMPANIQSGSFNNIQPIHDVALISLVAPTTALLKQLQLINMSVIARNEGNSTETFNVTVYAGTTEIETQKITDLTSGGKETLTFSWNITEATEGNYTISANATVLVSVENPIGIDEDSSDNTKTTQIILEAIHDVAVTSVITSQPTVIGPPMLINVTVANEGSYNENVTVTVSYKTVLPPYDIGVVGVENFTLAKGPTFNAVSLSWNTTGLDEGLYEINATATIEADEHLADNTETTRITLALGHDVAIKRIFAPTSVDIGELVTIRVQVENPGGYNETFDVEVTYDTSTIEEPYSATMLPGASEYISFSWNTTGVTPDSYTLTARAVLDGDINPANNLETKSIIVKLPLGTIVGNVTDASTGLPIAGATVTAGDYTNISDANGYYVMSGVTPGNYTVTASATGYESASQHNRVVISGETVTVNFALQVNSVITLSVDPTTITVGESITVSGSIDPIRENVTVTIWYRTSQGTWITLTTVTTDENSQYSHVWTVETIGTYEVKGSWLGDENTAPAESNVQTITVEEAPSGIPWELYVAAAGVTAVIIAAIAFYFLKIRRPKPT